MPQTAFTCKSCTALIEDVDRQKRNEENEMTPSSSDIVMATTSRGILTTCSSPNAADPHIPNQSAIAGPSSYSLHVSRNSDILSQHLATGDSTATHRPDNAFPDTLVATRPRDNTMPALATQKDKRAPRKRNTTIQSSESQPSHTSGLQSRRS